MADFKLCSVRPRYRIHSTKKNEKIQAKKTRPKKSLEPQYKRIDRFSLSNLGTYVSVKYAYTAILRKVVGKSVNATNPKGNMGYD